MAAQFAALGVKVKATATAGGDDFRVSDENWPTLLLFLGLQTQWNVVLGNKGLLWNGLNYVAVESYMRLMKVKGKRKRMIELQAMEGAALTIFSGAKLSDEEFAWATA